VNGEERRSGMDGRGLEAGPGHERGPWTGTRTRIEDGLLMVSCIELRDLDLLGWSGLGGAGLGGAGLGGAGLRSWSEELV
jgi:hypothetical protein